MIIVLGIIEDHIAGFLTEHYDGCNREESGHPRKCARIHHAQVVDAAHAEAAIQNREWVVAADQPGERRSLIDEPGGLVDERIDSRFQQGDLVARVGKTRSDRPRTGLGLRACR
jgi:hypothetical protein